MMFGESIIREFEKFLSEAEKMPSTIKKYIHDVTAFSKWLGGRELCKASVMEYKSEMMQKYSVSALNSALSALNSFFSFLGRGDLIIKTLRVQRQIFSDNKRELTKSEYMRLLNAAKSMKNKRLYYILQTICSTGIRISELKYVTVASLKRGQAVIRCKGKTRVILIPRRLASALKKYAALNAIIKGSVFVTKYGNPVDRSNVWSEMKKLCKAANVAKEKVFPHNLRHLFARTFYAKEKDIVRLADILGHSSVNTTRIYTMETCEERRKSIQNLGLLLC